MRQRGKRLWAFILVLTMLLSIMPESISAGEIPESRLETTSENGAEETFADTSDSEETDEDTKTVESDKEETPQTEKTTGMETETEIEGSVSDNDDNMPQGDADDNRLMLADLQNRGAEIVFKTAETLSLQYDDRYSFAEDFSDYAIAGIETIAVTSNVVRLGMDTGEKDEAVLYLKEKSDDTVIAAGVGTAEVILVPFTQLEDARAILNDTYTGEEKKIEAIKVKVTVEPATLTMMFLAGQSNMEGICTSNTGSHPEDSVLCEEGQVYSTYVPYAAGGTSQVAGVDFTAGCTIDNVEDFVAASLTGNESLSGNSLEYPLSALTAAGKGKTGPDSGLAYEWSRLTGDKVWTVNAAVGGTKSANWQINTIYYERALALYKAAIKTMNAEVSAGHYIEGERLLFWQHGETDGLSGVECSEYISNFITMYEGLKEGCGIDYCGIIVCRAHTGSDTNADDIVMTGPRMAQYLMAADKDTPDIYMVSNVNEQWITDGGVKSYFAGAYPEGNLTYPLRSNTTLTGLPTTVSDVHGNVHYSQVGHNENGITAANCMYHIIQKSSGTASVKWLNAEGSSVTSLNCQLGECVMAVPSVSPLYLSKEINYSIDTSRISYDKATGYILGIEKGKGSIRLTDSSGNVLGTLQITVGDLTTPEISSASNRTSGIVLEWNYVSGMQTFYVYRKTGSGGWTRIGSTSSNTYTDKTAKSGTSYSYTIRASYKGTLSNYNKTGVQITRLNTPALKSVANTSSGVKITWGSVTGASQYYVYRKSSGSGSWTRIGSVNTVNYTDKTAVSGEDYAYTVIARGASFSSDYDRTGKTIRYLGKPSGMSVKNSVGSVTVTWKQVDGATDYVVYRKTGTGAWTRVGISDSESFSDTTVKNGVTYVYTVRARYGGVMSDYDTNGVSVLYISAPVLSGAANNAAGVKVTWEAVKGASQYSVYRKNDSGGWDRIGNVTTTSYVDSDVTSGKRYTYTVIARNGANASYFDQAGVSVVYLSQPVLAGGEFGADYVTISWQQVPEAQGYHIYRKTGSGSWVRIVSLDDGTEVSYTDRDVTAGVTYTYTVRAYSEGTLSSYDSGKEVRCTEPPAAVTSIKAAGGECKVSLSWGSAKNATGYLIEVRKEGEDTWTTAVSGTSGTSCEVKNLEPGKKYYFRILSYIENSVFRNFGEYSKEVSGIPTEVIPGKPIGVKTTAGDMCIKLSWTAGTNATGYNICLYDAATGEMKSLGSTRSTSYTVKNLTNGTKYSFVIRSYRQCGDHITRSGYTSAVSGTPVMIPPTAPKSLTVTYKDNNNNLSWPAVTNATGYYVYLYNYSTNKYELLSQVTTNSYVHKNNGKTGKYKYQVKTYRVDNGKTYVSSDSVTKIVFGADEIKRVQSEVHPIYYGATINQGTRLYKTFSASEKCGTINAGERVTVLYRRTKRCKIKRSNGEIVYVKTSALNYTSQQYTSKDYSKEEKEVFINSMGYSSSTKYLIWLNTYTQKVNIFKGSKGEWELYKTCKCATGAIDTPTPLGSFSIWAKQSTYKYAHSYYKYLSKFKDSNSFHTRVRYYRGGFVDSRLGQPLSHGCVRMYDDDAKYIYDNVPKGTTVIVY